MGEVNDIPLQLLTTIYLYHVLVHLILHGAVKIFLHDPLFIVTFPVLVETCKMFIFDIRKLVGKLLNFKTYELIWAEYI